MIQAKTIAYPKAHMNEEVYRVDIQFWAKTWDEIDEMFTKFIEGVELRFVATGYYNKYGEAIRRPEHG